MKKIVIIILSLFLFWTPSHGKVITKALKKAPSLLSGTTLNNIEKKITARGVETYAVGRRIIKNEKIFKKNTTDALGHTNCQRMKSGFSPIGIDGYPINLHHLHQKNDGIIVEILDTEHRYYNKELHSYKQNSEIDRGEFNKWKKEYWMDRGLQLCR